MVGIYQSAKLWGLQELSQGSQHLLALCLGTKNDTASNLRGCAFADDKKACASACGSSP